MHVLPKLDYAYDALEPHIDAKTMEIHHAKHHQAYIDKLNAAIKGTPFENWTVEDLIKQLNEVPENIRNAVRNHGGGHLNHSFFWKIMAPKTAGGGGEPAGKIGEAIKKTFGSFEKFKEEFSNAGLNRFGSGWAWLVVDKEKLAVVSTSNQDNPISEGKTPILGCDVWEHAYYLKYQNKRGDYLQNWWNLVNWKEVEKHFAVANKKV